MDAMDAIDKMRCFVGASLPADARRDLAAILADLPRDKGVRPIPESGWHVTIRFFGDVPKAAVPELASAIGEEIGALPPIETRFERGGAFPSMRFPRALFVGFGGDLPAFHELAAAVDRAASPFTGSRDHPFVPHVTVARARTGRPVDVLEALARIRPSREFALDEVALYSSELTPTAAIHRVVRAWTLADPSEAG
jgi:2'-5' RNA ligase